MRNLMKLIAITAMAVMLLFAMITFASADEKIYTSPVFRLPRERLEQAEEILEAQDQESEPEESEEPGEEPEGTEAEPGEGVEPEEGTEPGEGTEPEEGTEPKEVTEPEEGTEPKEGTEPEEVTEPEEGTEPEDGELPDDDEDFEELEESAGAVTEQPARQKREVIIKSSQGAVVSEGEVITLTSELRGFGDDEQVTYQWQVDRGDGNGWVDVSGGDRSKYIFIADKETITYSWRLIVNVIDD